MARMSEVYILNPDLETIGMVEAYKSLIWAKRYNTVGDCELYVPATAENLDLLRTGRYIMRTDDDMVCQIKTIELDTDAENGNYLTVTAYDVKRWLDQRIVWETQTVDGNLETFIRTLVDGALGSTADSRRQMVDSDGNLIFHLASAAGFTETLTEQISYKNIGEKVREYCSQHEWGYKLTRGTNGFYFQLYKGADKTNAVIFSPNYENLSSSMYTRDTLTAQNVALVAGEGEGSSRARAVCGFAESVERVEFYVDSKDVSAQISYGELRAAYPLKWEGGNAYIAGNVGFMTQYMVEEINVLILDANHLEWLEENYPDGTVVTISGRQYYYLTDVKIADLPSQSPALDAMVTLTDLLYDAYLFNRGYTALGEHGITETFEGSIEPSTTFQYKEDYDLGDLVTVENEFGISASVRIMEVVEVNDDNGYRVEPKFEITMGV